MRQRFKEDYVRLNKDLCGRLWLQCMVCVCYNTSSPDVWRSANGYSASLDHTPQTKAFRRL